MRVLALIAGLIAGKGMAEEMPKVEPAEQAIAIPAETLVAFAAWRAGFRDLALGQGIAPATFDAAFADLAYLPDVVAKDRNQAEFTRTIWDYLDLAVSDKRVAEGRAALVTHAETLARIEAEFAVEKEVVVAIWGMESSYGANRGDFPVIASLASLAFDGRRKALFEAQLIAALRILQTGEVAPATLRGSWAGAMGHTQFMPTSWLTMAVDFTGDGRRDIWGDDPTDALASAASYLARSGWTKGQPWGVEVSLPPGFDHANSGKRDRRPVADWAALGLRQAGGADLADHGTAALLLPAGAAGPAFLIFGNFAAIEKYNAADAYVMAVGHLADRLSGRGPIIGGWPRDQRALIQAERVELQQRLTAAGFDTGGADGIIGPNSIAALRAYQKARGLPADGYPGTAMLDQLRSPD